MKPLSQSQVDMLIEHMDGRRHPPLNIDSGNRYHTMNALISRDFIRVDERCRPPLTYITDSGRFALTATFAIWIEGLHNGYLATVESMARQKAEQPDKPRKTAQEAHRRDPEAELLALLRQHRRRTQAEHWAEESLP